MKRRKTLMLIAPSVAVMIAFGGLSGASPVFANDIPDVDAALESYLDAGDLRWEGKEQQPFFRNAVPKTEASWAVDYVRDGMAESGHPIEAADSTYEVLGVMPGAPNTFIANVLVSTTFIYGGEGWENMPDGVWVDEHQITFDASGAGVRVLEDVIIEPTPDDDDDPLPQGVVPPVASSSDMSASDLGGPVRYRQPSPNVADMQEYAMSWTNSTYAGDNEKHFNPKYPYFSNNCANFASQVLRAGGGHI